MNIKLENSCPPSLKCPPPPSLFPSLDGIFSSPHARPFWGTCLPLSKNWGYKLCYYRLLTLHFQLILHHQLLHLAGLLLAVGCWSLLVIGCWSLLAVGYWSLLVIGCWSLLVIGCWSLLAVGRCSPLVLAVGRIV